MKPMKVVRRSCNLSWIGVIIVQDALEIPEVMSGWWPLRMWVSNMNFLTKKFFVLPGSERTLVADSSKACALSPQSTQEQRECSWPDVVRILYKVSGTEVRITSPRRACYQRRRRLCPGPAMIDLWCTMNLIFLPFLILFKLISPLKFELSCKNVGSLTPAQLVHHLNGTYFVKMWITEPFCAPMT